MASSPLANRTVVSNHNARNSPAKAAVPSSSGANASGSLSPPRSGENGNGLVRRSSYNTMSSARSDATEGAQWGENFWITIVDPQTGAQFYACPATGDASWEPPAGHFVMPPSDAGDWWELLDEARDIPYYYHTKTKETQWTRPEGFVIPLNIIQTTTALGRKFSLNARKSMVEDSPASSTSRSYYRNSRSPNGGPVQPRVSFSDHGRRTASGPSTSSPASSAASNSNTTGGPGPRPSRSYGTLNGSRHGHSLYTIPSEPSNSQQSLGYIPDPSPVPAAAIPIPVPVPSSSSSSSSGIPELRTQSLQGAVAKITASNSLNPGNGTEPLRSHSPAPSTRSTSSKVRPSAERKRSDSPSGAGLWNRDQTRDSPPGSKSKKGGGMFSKMLSSSTNAPPSSFNTNGNGTTLQPSASAPAGASLSPANRKISLSQSYSGPPPSAMTGANAGSVSKATKDRLGRLPNTGSMTDLIGAPVLDRTATEQMNPAMRNGYQPVLVDPRRLSSGTIPRELAQEISQFMTSEFAQSYFSTHRRGLIFRRRVPLEEMMAWQRPPLTSPLLSIKRQWNKDAVKIFKIIQCLMGDREFSRHLLDDSTSPPSRVISHSQSMPGTSGEYQVRTGGGLKGSAPLLEQERWMLSMGLSHGELRDEIYCQLMKQLTSNPDEDSLFRGWQLFCVILVTFPPSKNLEAYVGTFIQERITTKRDDPGRIDVMAKYCLGRLNAIARKGPRGKAPTLAEIETASDAAFNPSTFGAPLDFIYKLQQRSYPEAKVPIILPFLGDGIIALGGLQTEGIWRISGDNETVSELKVRIDRGYYNLEGIDDCHVPASLLKLWLRELEDPLIPESMYNECLAVASEPDKVVGMVRKLPAINRRVLLFVISLLQLFLHEEISSVTKMTSPALALVISPALLRCNSDKFSTVFTNAQHENTFVHNLLLHLEPHRIDPDYVPIHGQGSASRSR